VPVAVGKRSRFLKFCKKGGQKGPNPVLPEGAVGMGTRSVPGATPLRWPDLEGPKDTHGYAGCPMGGPGLDFRAKTRNGSIYF